MHGARTFYILDKVLFCYQNETIKHHKKNVVFDFFFFTKPNRMLIQCNQPPNDLTFNI